MNKDYILLTDDANDLPPEYYKKHNVEVVELSYNIDGVDFHGSDRPIKEFYDDIRAGKQPISSQVNQQAFYDKYKKYLDEGKDVIYLAFSSGLSGTCNSGQAAAKRIQEEYPDRKIYVVDGLCASLGHGLWVHKAVQKRDEGATIDELRDYAEGNKLNIQHIFTVDDLMHLHRGGRVSKTAAVAGSLLGIKPVMYMDNKGTLQPRDKIRGRKQSLIHLVDTLEKQVGDNPDDTFFISHGDCEEDAQFVIDLMKKRFDIKEHLIYYVGSVIGTHTGPGVVALFMEGGTRE